MGKTPGSFTNARKQKLHYVQWIPEGQAVKAVIFYHHGFGEYIDRFDHSFKSWSEAGIATFGFDAHGHGQSEPLDDGSRALIRSFSHLVDDAVQFFTEIIQPQMKDKAISAPLFMGGNSLGGLVASYVVLAKPDAFAGLVMQSPAINVEWNPVLRVQAMLGNLLALLVPRAKLVPAVRPEDMSQDPDAVKAYLEDPMIYKGNVKALSGNEILKGFTRLTKFRKDFKLPIYAVMGSTDRCTSLKALKEHLAQVSSTDKTLVEVAGGYHELQHGPEKAQVLKGIADWVLQHAAAAPAVAAASAAATGDKDAAAVASADVQVAA